MHAVSGLSWDSIVDVPQNLDRPHTTVLYSAWMGALFSAEWGKSKAEEEDEDVWQGGEEEEARNGSRNGLKFIAHTQPDSPARPRGGDATGSRRWVSELR